MYITLLKYIVEFMYFSFNTKYSVDVFDDQMYGLFFINQIFRFFNLIK